jgi:hypothetical protein
VKLPRRTGFANFRRRCQRPGVDGRNGSGERREQNAVIVVAARLAKPERTSYIATPRLPERGSRHVSARLATFENPPPSERTRSGGRRSRSAE